MPTTRFRIQDIHGRTPAVDARNIDQAFLLKGKNYYFDSKGPKSGPGSRLVTNSLETIEDEGGVVQSVQETNRNLVCTTRGVFELTKETRTPKFTMLRDFSDFLDVPWIESRKWFTAYLATGVYLAHSLFGFYKLGVDELAPLATDDIPGLPSDVIGVCENNGRLFVLSRHYMTWSAPTAPEDFRPTIGGAGQQLTRELLTGRPIGLASFQRGVIVWTDEGSLFAEFIGGPTVYRFVKLATKQLPLNPFCAEIMPDGVHLLLTYQGLHVIENGQEPRPITPVFNEFIRGIFQQYPKLIPRINYLPERDQIWVQLRDDTNHYVRTFVLSAALDKWGEFSHRHLGVIKITDERGDFGYVDAGGVPHRFVDTFTREVSPGSLLGLDSEVEIGYIKPPELTLEADTQLEMQELTIGGQSKRPKWAPHRVDDLGAVIPNWSPECDLFTVDLRFTQAEAIVNGTNTFLHEVIEGYPHPWIVNAQGFENLELSMDMGFGGDFLDMTGWVLNYTWRPYPDPGDSRHRGFRVRMGMPNANYGFNACSSGALLPPNTRFMLEESFRIIGDNLRCAAISHWVSVDGEPRPGPPTVSMAPLLTDAFECGVTYIFEILGLGGTDEEYVPVMVWWLENGSFIRLEYSLTNPPTEPEIPEEPIEPLFGPMAEEERILKVQAVFSNGFERDPLAVTVLLEDANLFRIGFTFNRFIEDAFSRGFDLSVNGSEAISREIFESPFHGREDELTSSFMSNPFENTVMGEGQFMRRTQVFNAVSPLSLEDFTSVGDLTTFTLDSGVYYHGGEDMESI